MSALPSAQPVEAADAELMADLAAHLRGASASQFLNAALHGLSPSEVRFADEASVRAERNERPVGELDATLMIGDLKLTFSVAVYGTFHPHFPGDREQPEEREFIEIDRVILSSGPDSNVDIYDALSWSDLQSISDAILEGQ